MDAEQPLKTQPAQGLLQNHLGQPEVSLNDYARRKRISHGRKLLSMHRIYLDTLHWVHLRDVALERLTTEIRRVIYATLEELVKSERAICPVSCSTFMELLHQSDPSTRRATARVIDTFARSSCILPPHEVLNCEVLYFMRRIITPSAELYLPREMVWTKPAFVLGNVYPTNQHLPPHVLLAMQKTMDDVLWSASMETVVSQLPAEITSTAQDRQAFAQTLTNGKRNAAAATAKFEELFLHEVAGCVDVVRQELGKTMAHLCRTSGHGEPTAAEIEQAGNQLANVIYRAFEHRRISTELPSIHIGSGLHAALRCNQAREYKPGDVEDFRHATQALPYFNVFCTDRSLQHLLSKPPLEYDKAYGTRILSSDDEVLEYLQCLRQV